ncbi:MAG: hypothetical protein GY754_29185, partial [bacterium]|nr:hypothetical protein [bacterium]
MRCFSSYGPISRDSNYYVPREELLKTAHTYLIGENPNEGGHYITVWASRQTGKSTVLRDLYWQLRDDEMYYVANIDIQDLSRTPDSIACMNSIIFKINTLTKLNLPKISKIDEFQQVFSKALLKKPLVLIIDEFDALEENVITDIVGIFRNIYINRKKDPEPSPQKEYLLHGVALIGVRSVVGIENKSGSPFNVQKSLHIPNLTEAEVNEMYHWYERESGQKIDQEVIDRIFYVTQGQPGLVSWFGELLTRDYNKEPEKPLSMKQWDYVYMMALQALPNNNIINIISKAKTEPYRKTVLDLFKTADKMEFRFENLEISFLYMNGVISNEEIDGNLYVKFPCQFVQEKLFDFFSHEIVAHTGSLLANPFIDLDPIINDKEINVKKLLELYQEYFTQNRESLLEYAQRRVDLSVMEVVYHFQLYSWLESFFQRKGWKVLPEFPTGNGKIDLILRNKNKTYGLELKSFTDLSELNKSIQQASDYGKSLSLEVITLVVFLDRPMP